MVIHNLDIAGTGGVLRPREADPPLVVDTDAVLPGTVAPEGFQAIARQAAQIAQAGGSGQDLESLVGLPIETGEGRHALTCREPGRSLIPKAHDHTPP